MNWQKRISFNRLVLHPRDPRRGRGTPSPRMSPGAMRGDGVPLPRRGGMVALFVLLSSFISGCCTPPPPPIKTYNGPTDPMGVVVADINRNNQKIPSLWATLNYSATIVDGNKHVTTFTREDGGLLYRRPQSLLLTCKVLGSKAFTIGSNDEVFWMEIGGSTDTAWWGHYANLYKPCCKPLPISPDLMLEVLGVGLFDKNFLDQPTPVMRFDNDADAYIFDWNFQGMDRWMTQKEIWYDRATHHPTQVRLFDENGRIILRAMLGNHAPLEIPDAPRETWPTIAQQYDLLFPDTGSKISFTFVQATTEHKGRPNASSFKQPDFETSHVIQVDRDCGG
jgi:hypothetical protein